MQQATASTWEKEQWLAPADVVIAGGGLLGLWTALAMKERHPALRVVVLERSAFSLGASTRNAGFACFGSPTELMHDARTMGADTMLQLVDMRYRGIRKTRELLGDAAIGFEPCGGYECFTHWSDHLSQQLQQLNDWLAPVVHHPAVFSMASDQLSALGLTGFAAMVANPLEGALHSGRLVQQLTHRVVEMGVTVQAGMEVLGWQECADGWQVQTSRGAMRAAYLVLATNAWLSEMAPDLGIRAARGQVLVTKPIPGIAMRGTFHYDEGYYYWRHLGNRILLGGARNQDFEGEETLAMHTSPIIQQALQQFLTDHLPQYFHEKNVEEMIDMRWSGLMAMSASKLPVLKALGKGLWAAMCCNGMGVALSPVFAEKVAEAVLTA